MGPVRTLVLFTVSAVAVVPGSLAVCPAGAGAASGSARRMVTVVGTGVAGTPEPHGSASGSPPRSVALDGPAGLAFDARGDLFVADTGHCRVLEVPVRSGRRFGVTLRAGRASVVAGTGCRRGTPPASGRATASPIGHVEGLATDALGDLFLADTSGNRVLELSAHTGADPLAGASVRTGQLLTVAGTGGAGFAGDGGPPRLAELQGPAGLAVDGLGDLLIADTGNCRVREVTPAAGSSGGTPQPTIRTVAGSAVCGYAGDGGAADRASLLQPTAVAVDRRGNLYIADAGSDTVRVVSPAGGTVLGVEVGAGDIATVAGMGSHTVYPGDGFPATGQLSEVDDSHGVAVGADGDLFVSDTLERAVRQVPAVTSRSGRHTLVADDMYTVAGALPAPPLGNGTTWVLGHVVSPTAVAVDPATGRLYFADSGGNVVREIEERPGSG